MSLLIHALLGLVALIASSSTHSLVRRESANSWAPVSMERKGVRVPTPQAAAPRKAYMGANPVSSGGTGLSTENSGAQWAARLRERVQGQLQYPFALRRRRIEGRVNLTLLVNNGTALTEVASSSGSAELDHLALEAANQATRELPPTPGFQGRIQLPVDFVLRQAD